MSSRRPVSRLRQVVKPIQNAKARDPRFDSLSAGIIEDVRFKTFGCGSAIASSSYMTERVKGLSLDEAAAIKNTEVARELSLPPVKLHCSMLAEDAIKSAINDYRKRRNETGNFKQGHIEVMQDVASGQTTATPHVGSGTV